MAYQELNNLARSYSSQSRDALSKLAARYSRRQEREVLELAALASDVSIDDITTLNLEPESNSLLREAFGRQYPNVSLDSLKGATEERLQGLANGVKGKYFELLVRNKLNAGERLGDVQLEPGQTARLASSPTQPGWDLRIEDSNGEVVQDLQLKATDSMSYAKAALDKYPDIPVVVPNELEYGAALRDDLMGSSISNDNLEQETERQLGELTEGTIKNLADNSADFAFDAIPFASFAVIIASEGGRKLLGRSALKEAILATQRSKGRLLRAGAFSTVGTVLMMTPAGPVAVPTTIALRLTVGRIRNISAAGDHMGEKTEEILMELERSRSRDRNPG